MCQHCGIADKDSTDSGPSLWQTIRGDFAAATGLKLLAVIGLLAWMAFQWGLGNDILLPSLAASALDAVDDGESWSSGLAAVAAAAAAGGLFWALVQCLDAVLMLSGIRLIPGITARISAFLRRKDLVTPYATCVGPRAGSSPTRQECLSCAWSTSSQRADLVSGRVGR